MSQAQSSHHPTALAHLGLGEKIINSTSVTDRRGSPHLIDHASTKSPIVSITRSLAEHLKERKVRVNAVRRVRSGRL
jgi:NAD(P)-dependent dehydrogenase (short-subunit alcohol dehydrogenase family)